MEAGSKLGPYEIVDKLGAGGMGEVWLAEDSRLGRKVAIKVLPAQFASDPERLARFEQEARASAALNHPNIAAVFDIGVEGEGAERTHFMVQEFLEGETLQELIERGTLTRKKALTLGAEIAQALAAAHDAGIIHRDLKPANVFVLPNGHAKVLDFGLAKLTEMSPASTSGDGSMSPTVMGTMTGSIMGTAGYMAPEQITGEGVDRRADLFAFGCVLHEMLGGGRAFAGKSVPDTLARILHHDVEPLPNLPGPLARLLDKCLAKDPAERYQHADDLAVDLRHLATVPDTSLAVSAGAGGGDESSSSGVNPLLALALVVVALACGYLVARVLGSSAVPGSGSGGDLPLPTQLTEFSTGVRDPAVSTNGQMLAFVADDPVDGWSQIYVKTLPDGPPLQLTNNPGHKRTPAFSPDGSRIAYSVYGEDWKWDTWSVSINGGEPRQTLVNASSLTWTPDGRILFSKFREGAHLGITLADESGANQEDLWFPPQGYQMAHYSDLSPDGSRVLIGYMGASGGSSLRCFVSELPVPDGEPEPLVEDCSMYVRFSPDGAWVYYRAMRAPEIRRVPAVGGTPQVLVGQLPGFDDIDGFDLTPDGRSLIYAAGTSPNQVWHRRADGTERRITFAGESDDPHFTADGRYIVYRQGSRPGTLWRYRVADGTREQICPGLPVERIVVGLGSNRVLIGSRGDPGRAQYQLCHVDGSEPPRTVVADVPFFAGPPAVAPGGDLAYYTDRTEAGIEVRAVNLTTGDVTLVRTIAGHGEEDAAVTSVSPDSGWLAVNIGLAKSNAWLVPLDEAVEPRPLVDGWDFRWGPDGSSFLFTNDGMVSSAWQLANPDGRLAPAGLPERPTAEDLQGAGAVRLFSAVGFARASVSPRLYEATYAFTEPRTNLFRVDLPALIGCPQPAPRSRITPASVRPGTTSCRLRSKVASRPSYRLASATRWASVT